MKTMETLGLCTHTRICVRRFDVCVYIHGPAYIARVLEIMKGKFPILKTEVWNESHILGPLFPNEVKF